MYYINQYSRERSNSNQLLIATVGSELHKDTAQQSGKRNDGHSFAISDIIRTSENIFVKVRNSQTKMKINKEPIHKYMH